MVLLQLSIGSHRQLIIDALDEVADIVLHHWDSPLRVVCYI